MGKSGKEEECLVRGFYRQLHEAYYDLDFHQMSLPSLLKKVRSLEDQLARAKMEKDAKMAPLLGKLAPPMLPLECCVTEGNSGSDPWHVAQHSAQARHLKPVIEAMPLETSLPCLVLDRARSHS